ncbi:tyrosine-type recombinase/integrase [Desulfovibrio sp. OttesenSCG-928-I05]|nr:tyrosine-type recombinase/integrase [Desulfovibrio sp. OttesenSCG-928-I05]
MKGMIKTKFVGVYRYVSDTKRFDGKPDECFYYSYRDQDKKFRWHKVGWRSEKVTAQYAADKRSEFMVAARNGEKPKQTRKEKGITFGKGFDVFEDKWFPNLKNNGADIALRYRVHTAPLFADTPIDKITPLALEDYKLALFRKGLAPATVRLILGDMRNVINKLKKWGLFKGDSPFEQVDMPKVDNARTRFLSRNEADLLLETINTHSRKWFLISTIALNTGARLGEVTGTRIHDLQHETRVWQIKGKTGRRSITLNDAAWNAFMEALEMRQRIIVFTSGLVDQATIDFVSQETGLFPTDVCYLHLECVDMERGLITYRRRNSAKFKTYRISEAVRPVFEEWVGKCSSDLVFTGRGGKRIGSNKTKTFDRSASECGLNPAGIDSLDKVVFHTLRHTYCSWEAIKGTPLFKIARLVGHKTTTMTERYSHLCPITESQNLINKDNDTTLEQLNSILTHLIEEKGIGQVPQSVIDWLAKVG